MDQRQFDRLARLLGGATDRRAGLKAAFGALLGAGGAAAALELDAEAKKQGKDNERKGAAGPDAEKRKKRKKTCKPACEGGYECVKQGKKRVCACASGVECGGACCLVGQTCEGGTCVADPQPTTCLAFGEACKNVGKRCCDGLSCASGQDGSFPVACYKSKGAACASSAECPFGMSCTGGVCRGNGGGGGGGSVPTGQPCAAGTTCDQPGATCTAYTTAGAPGGDFCTLPLRQSCSGDVDCTCYKCWYSNAGGSGGSRSGRASANTKACCHMPGQACSGEGDCCSGLSCTNGVCGGTLCVPEGGIGCSADVPCCGGNTCNPDGTCSTGPKPLGASCSADDQCLSGLCWYPQDADGYPINGAAGYQKVCVVALGGECPTVDAYAPCGLGNYCGADNTCTDTWRTPGDYALEVPVGGTGCNDANGPECYDGSCIAGTCLLEAGDYCDNGDLEQGDYAGPAKFCPSNTDCRKYTAYPDDYDYCLLPNTATCDYGDECASYKCETVGNSDICVECITDAACEKIKGAPDPCKRWSCSASTRSCEQVVATNTLCTLTGGATGFCQANGTCGATTATCDVTTGSATDLVAAINNAPYKSAVTVKGTYTPTAEIALKKMACRDNTNPDTDVNGVGACNELVPWDVTLVRCSGETAAISGGSTVSNADPDPTKWTWVGGHRVLLVRDYDLTVYGITLQNGVASDFGGGILVLASGQGGVRYPVVKLENLTVTGCKAQNGGGIAGSDVSLILKGVTLDKNWATRLGGGMWQKADDRGSFVLENVTMTGNVANDATANANCSGAICQGAGIFVDGSGTSNTCRNQPANAINNLNMSYYSTAVVDCGKDSGAPGVNYAGCGCATPA